MINLGWELEFIQYFYLWLFLYQGSIIGGLIGINAVKYDIFGKDMIIAKKVKDLRVADKIIISEMTKKLVEKQFICEDYV